MTAILVVEGKNDQHVVWALCEQHNVPETFAVEIAGGDEGGVDTLLTSIPVRLKMAGLRSLGIVLDADENLQSRWEGVRDRLYRSGYDHIPEIPQRTGTIIEAPERPRVGVWLMPNNELPGMLEDFVGLLIPDNDPLRPKAESTLAEIENENLNLYRPAHRPKALIHTWLAWQETPGQPMGQAITAHALDPDSLIAVGFVQWILRLFNE